MSSYFMSEILYEKRGCPGSTSKSQEGQKGQSGAGKGGARCLERIWTKDKTNYDQVLQGLYHILRAPVNAWY